MIDKQINADAHLTLNTSLPTANQTHLKKLEMFFGLQAKTPGSIVAYRRLTGVLLRASFNMYAPIS